MHDIEQTRQLLQLAEVRLIRAQSDFAQLLQEEREHTAALAALEDPAASEHRRGAAVTEFHDLEALFRWQKWAEARRRTLNLSLAQVLARKETLRLRLQRALGRKTATEAILKDLKEHRKNKRARRVL